MIATFDGDRMEESARIWERLLAIPKASLHKAHTGIVKQRPGGSTTLNFLPTQIAALHPYLTIYNQDFSGKSSGWLEDKMRTVLQNGRVIYLDNKGRESRVYMYHIVNNWDNLYRCGALALFQLALIQLTPASQGRGACRYTWFSQDLPSEYAKERVEVR